MRPDERIRIVGHCAKKLSDRDVGEIDFILNTFGIPTPLVWSNNHRSYDYVRDTLRDTTEENLLALYDHLRNANVAGIEEADDSGLWEEDSVRVFLSHSATHKEFVPDVAEALRLYGIHGFVAHASIEVSREWQAEIERALHTAQVFVGLVHPEFNDSAWTNQELGWAYGRAIPVFMIRLGADPRGFPGKTQWPQLAAQPEAVAGRIAQFINSYEQFAGMIGGRLIMALRRASSYQDAGRAAQANNEFGALTQSQWEDLDHGISREQSGSRRIISSPWARSSLQSP